LLEDLGLALKVRNTGSLLEVGPQGHGRGHEQRGQHQRQDRRPGGESEARPDRGPLRRNAHCSWGSASAPAAGGPTARPKAWRPAYRAVSSSSSSIRRSWLYLAVRSPREGAPVLIWPAFVATARSAMVVSSVSPERWLMTTP